jgi:hypothetical protein
MKKLIILLIICLLQGCESQSYLSKDEKTQELTTTLLEIRDGVAYLPKSTELFTGKFVYYCEEGKNSLHFVLESSKVSIGEAHDDDGMKGSGETFSPNTAICIEENYLNGKKNGLSITLDNDSKSIYNPH